MAPFLRSTPKSYRSSQGSERDVCKRALSLAAKSHPAPTPVRSCILYEFQLGRSIDEAYKHFRKITKNVNFYYVEFAYWFDRFANGKFDLDDDSFDEKPLTFSDLPYDILGEIVGKLDTKSRFSTRKVSRFLRNVVDNQPMCDEMKIYFEDDDIIIQYKTHYGIYKKHGDNCIVYDNFFDLCQKIRGKALNGDFVDIALNDMAIALKNPKLQLENFHLLFAPEADTYDGKVLKFFESLKSPIHVKSVTFHSRGVQFVLPVLSLLKPGTLEEINLCEINTEMIANQLVKTDQWKQAKCVSIHTPMPVGIENFLHFKVFNVAMKSISADDVIFLRDNLSECDNFKSCALSVYQSNISISVIKQIREKFGAGVIIPSHQAALISLISHRHPIPGTNEHLLFWITPRELSIERTD